MGQARDHFIALYAFTAFYACGKNHGRLAGEIDQTDVTCTPILGPGFVGDLCVVSLLHPIVKDSIKNSVFIYTSYNK